MDTPNTKIIEYVSIATMPLVYIHNDLKGGILSPIKIIWKTILNTNIVTQLCIVSQNMCLCGL